MSRMRPGRYSSLAALAPAPAGGSLTFVQGSTTTPQTTGGTTSVTFNTVTIGNADVDRLLVITGSVFHTAAHTLSLTVGGIAATLTIANSTANARKAALFQLPITSVLNSSLRNTTTATIVITGSGSFGISEAGIATGWLTGAFNATPTQTAAVTYSTTDPATSALTIPSGGVGIICAHISAPFPATWTNATEVFETAGTNQYSSLITMTTSATASGTNSANGIGLVAAVWGT